MWKIYSGYTKEHNPADFDHPSVITQMIGLQTMAHTLHYEEATPGSLACILMEVCWLNPNIL